MKIYFLKLLLLITKIFNCMKIIFNVEFGLISVCLCWNINGNEKISLENKVIQHLEDWLNKQISIMDINQWNN